MWRFEYDELQQTLANNQPALEWLKAHLDYPMATFAGAVLAPNIPGADVDGEGKLLLTEVGEGAFVVNSGVFWFIPNFWRGLTDCILTVSGTLNIQLSDPKQILLSVYPPDSSMLMVELRSRDLIK
jgi:hypothetical protein